jgi:hypothetical protein
MQEIHIGHPDRRRDEHGVEKPHVACVWIDPYGRECVGITGWWIWAERVPEQVRARRTKVQAANEAQAWKELVEANTKCWAGKRMAWGQGVRQGIHLRQAL